MIPVPSYLTQRITLRALAWKLCAWLLKGLPDAR